MIMFSFVSIQNITMWNCVFWPFASRPV